MNRVPTVIAAVVAAAALVIGVAAVVVRGGSGGEAGHARLVVPDGASARIDGADARRTVGPGRYDLVGGDEVEAVTRAVRIELAGGAALELREGFRGSDSLTPDDTAVRIGEHPVLMAGELLVVAGGSGAPHVGAAGTRFRVEGAARLVRSLSVTVAAYDGGVAVESAGRAVEVAALRQVTIVDRGLLPGRPVPLLYDERDPWDQRFLGDAIDLGKVLDARSRGFTAQLPAGAGRTAAFFTTVFADLARERAFTEGALCAGRPPGECLVGSAIALEGDSGTLGERLAEVFSFRGDGASWGLVALDQAAGREALLDRIDGALDRSPLLFAVGGTNPPEPPPAPPTTAPRPGGGTPPTTSPPPTTQPDPDDGPLPPPLDEPVDPLFDLIGDLLPPPTTTEPSEEPPPGGEEPAIPVLDDAVEQLGDLLGGGAPSSPLG